MELKYGSESYERKIQKQIWFTPNRKVIESTKHSNPHNLQQHEKESFTAAHCSELLCSKVLCIQDLQEDIENMIHYHP